MDSNELIREGFICPECREDLTSFSLLQAHFELKHSQILNSSAEDKITNNSLSCNKKDLIYKFVFFYKILLLQ